ncbi:hypothetical protein HKX48_001494, partial [Thoreauomyces humboldtii]
MAWSIPPRSRANRLKEHLTDNPPLGFPNLVARDWEVRDGRPDLGVGDLVFASADSTRFLVVETQALDTPQPHGSTSSRPTTTDVPRETRRGLAERVEKYATAWARRAPGCQVRGTSYVGFEVHDARYGDVYRPGDGAPATPSAVPPAPALDEWTDNHRTSSVNSERNRVLARRRASGADRIFSPTAPPRSGKRSQKAPRGGLHS